MMGEGRGAFFGLRRRRAVVFACVAVVLSGCSAGASPEPSASDPYAAEYQQAIDSTSSDFVKAVLADHHVTDSELAESQDSLIACLRDQGFEPLVTTENGRREVGVPADAGWECTDQWTGEIENLYAAERMNPKNENMYDLVAACMARIDLVPSGFTGKDLEDLDKQAEGSYVEQADGTKTDVVLPENPNPTLPSGMPIRAQETMGCWTSPLATGLG